MIVLPFSFFVSEFGNKNFSSLLSHLIIFIKPEGTVAPEGRTLQSPSNKTSIRTLTL